MKLTLRTTDEDTEQRTDIYGVQDFQVHDDSVEVYFPQGTSPRNEFFEGAVAAACDSSHLPENDRDLSDADRVIDRR